MKCAALRHTLTHTPAEMPGFLSQGTGDQEGTGDGSLFPPPVTLPAAISGLGDFERKTACVLIIIMIILLHKQ